MYNNIGGKIKGLAVGFFILEAIAAAVCGILLIADDEDTILIGLAIMIGCFFVAWLSSWITYGFGELIEKASVIEYNTRPRHMPYPAAPAPMHGVVTSENQVNATPNASGYICPQCKMQMDSLKPCDRYGYVPHKLRS